MIVDTGVFPLFEIEEGNLTLNGKSKRLHDPTKRKPIGDYFNKKNQGRFKAINEKILGELQNDTDRWWKWIDRFLVLQDFEEK